MSSSSCLRLRWISVYGIGIIIRPIGAYMFGDLADRRGRKDALVYALVLMGVSTLLIGLPPSYDSIGFAAPILLVLFRLLQGISFGAEFGTAATWVVEQAAHSKHRAFWARGSGLRCRSAFCSDSALWSSSSR
jgi:MFS family permease